MLLTVLVRSPFLYSYLQLGEGLFICLLWVRYLDGREGEEYIRLSMCAHLCSLGMLALEMLGRRAHNDHPNNFSRSPPYTDDVKWLLGLAAKLGNTSPPQGHFLPPPTPNLLPFPSYPRPPS